MSRHSYISIAYCSVSNFTGGHCWWIYYFVLKPADRLLTQKNWTHDYMWWSRLSQKPEAFSDGLRASGSISLYYALVLLLWGYSWEKEECEEMCSGRKKEAKSTLHVNMKSNLKGQSSDVPSQKSFSSFLFNEWHDLMLLNTTFLCMWS